MNIKSRILTKNNWSGNDSLYYSFNVYQSLLKVIMLIQKHA